MARRVDYREEAWPAQPFLSSEVGGGGASLNPSRWILQRSSGLRRRHPRHRSKRTKQEVA